MVELGNRRVLAPNKWRPLAAFGWMLALFVVVGLVFTFVYAALMLMTGFHPTSGGAFEGGASWSHVGIMAVSLAAAVGTYVLAVRFGEDRRASEFALRPALPEWLAGLGIGAVLMIVSVAVMAVFGFVTVKVVPVRTIAQALVDTLQSGILEELLFRLVIFRLLWRAFGAWWALGLSALIFGLLHLTNANSSVFAGLCIAFEAGILLAAFYVLTGRIWASIGVHMGWNFTQGWILGAAVSGTSGFAGGPLVTTPKPYVADWLDGGGFGPEAALPALVICTAAGLLVLRRARAAGRFAPQGAGSAAPTTLA